MCSFYITSFFIWMTEFQKIFRENFIAMFSCSQTLKLFGRIGQLVYPIFLQVFNLCSYFIFFLLFRCQIIAALLEVAIVTVVYQIKLWKGATLKDQNSITSKKMNQRGSYGKWKLIKTWMDLLSQITNMYALTIFNMGNLLMLHQFQLCLCILEKLQNHLPKK